MYNSKNIFSKEKWKKKQSDMFTSVFDGEWALRLAPPLRAMTLLKKWKGTTSLARMDDSLLISFIFYLLWYYDLMIGHPGPIHVQPIYVCVVDSIYGLFLKILYLDLRKTLKFSRNSSRNRLSHPSLFWTSSENSDSLFE